MYDYVRSTIMSGCERGASERLVRTVACAVVSVVLLCGCQRPDVHEYEPTLRARIAEPAAVVRAEPVAQQGVQERDWPEEPIGLAEAVEIAFANSPRLRAAAKSIRIAEEDIRIAGSAFWPQVSAAGNYNVLKNDINLGGGPVLENQFWQAELDLQWMLWDFGRSLGRYRQAEAGAEIARVSFRRFEQGLIYEVAEGYYGILRAQKAKTIALDGLRAAGLQLRTAKQLYAQDQVTRDDVLRAEVQVARYEQSVIRAGNAIKLALSGLNRSMGINVNWPTEVVDRTEEPEFGETLTWALEQAISHRPEFEQVQLGIALEQAGVRVAEAEYMPKLFVSSSLVHIEDRGQLSEDSALASLGIQVDLFAGGRRRAQVAQAEHKVSQSLDKARQVCDAISFEVKQAYLGIKDAEARLPVAEKALSAARENARLVQEKYASSLATATDVADAEAALTDSQEDYYRTLYDLMSAVERLYFAMGTNDAVHNVAYGGA